jgi:hypothetical protein
VDCQWQKVSCEAVLVCSDFWVVFLVGHPQEATLQEGDDVEGDDADVHPK